MTTPDGRVIFPGGKAEAKPFFKEMKKLINNWAVAMSRKYRHIQPSARRWADLADSIIDTLIDDDTETTMAFILGLENANDEAYVLALDATQIMAKHGATFYRPGGEGTRDPRNFVNESQDIMERRKKQCDEWLAGAEEYRRQHGKYPPRPF